MDIWISGLVFVKYHSPEVLEYLFVDLHIKVTEKKVEESPVPSRNTPTKAICVLRSFSSQNLMTRSQARISSYKHNFSLIEMIESQYLSIARW